MIYLQHPLSAAFPAMAADEFEALKDSITNIGVREPITLFEGMVLDGWHRYTAAQEVGMECPAIKLSDVDPQDFVIAKNKTRRHISASQVAAAVVAVYQWRPAGRPEKNSAPGAELSKSTKELAQIAGVGTRTIEQAKTVEAKASPEVKAAVKAGTMSVKKAAGIAQPVAASLDAKPARYAGKPKKVPASKLFAAQIEASDSRKAVEGAQEKVAALAQEAAALRETLAEANSDMASMAKVLDAGDQLSAALAEAKAARDLARGLQLRIDSMLTEIAELNRQLKYWKTKAGSVA